MMLAQAASLPSTKPWLSSFAVFWSGTVTYTAAVSLMLVADMACVVTEAPASSSSRVHALTIYTWQGCSGVGGTIDHDCVTCLQF